jgi:hypothetical protein
MPSHATALPASLPPHIEAAVQIGVPEFLDHCGLAHQLSCSVTTIHKLRREKLLGEPCQIGGLVRWHWPSVRERILGRSATALASDPFLNRLNGD